MPHNPPTYQELADYVCRANTLLNDLPAKLVREEPDGRQILKEGNVLAILLNQITGSEA